MIKPDIGKLLGKILPPEPQKEEWVMPKHKKQPPDALVLVTIQTTCRHCKKVYEAPNKHLMLQFGRKLLKHEYWDFKLPRKRITYRTEAQSCENCFGGAECEMEGESAHQKNIRKTFLS